MLENSGSDATCQPSTDPRHRYDRLTGVSPNFAPESPFVDVYWPIKHGSTIPLDWRYLTYAMLKTRIRSDITQRGWQLLPFFGRERGDILHFHREDGLHALRVRMPVEDVGYAHHIVGEPVHIGNHLLILGEPVTRALEAKPVLHSDLVLISSDGDTRGVRGMDFGFHVGKRLGAILGRTTFGVKFGDRRHIHIKSSRCFGHAVTVMGLTDEESMLLQSQGIGEARAMGCGVMA